MAKLIDVVAGDWGLHKGEDWEVFNKRQEKLLTDLKKGVGRNKIVGSIIKFQVADGYAFYRVESEKPLSLSHIPYGDAYQIPEAYMRGLTLSDVKDLLEYDRNLNKLFSKKS